MNTISYYLNKIIDLKKLLALYLTNKNIECSDTDSLNILVAKTESIVSPVTNEISLPDFSLTGCTLNTDELENLISKLNLSNPNKNISYKWYNVPNLKKLCLKTNWNYTEVNKHTSAWSNTPLEELDVSDISFTSTLAGLPTTLKKLNVTNTGSQEMPSFNGMPELEEIIGLNTLILSKNPTSLALKFADDKLLKHIDLQGIDLSACTSLSSVIKNTESLETFILDESFNINNLSSTGLQNAFYGSNIVDDTFLSQLGLDVYDYKGKNLGGTFGYIKPEKDESGCYNLNEKLAVLDFSNTTEAFNIAYTTYDYRHLQKLNFKNCTLELESFSNLVGADSIGGHDYLPRTFVDEIDFTNTVIKLKKGSTQNTSNFLARLGERYENKYDVIPKVIFDNTTFYFNTYGLQDFLINSRVETIDLSNVTILPDSGATNSTYLTMNRFGAYCPNLKTIKMRYTDLPVNFYDLGYGSPKLETVDIDGIDMSPLTNTSNMFLGCSSLTNVLFGINLGKGFTAKKAYTSYYSLNFKNFPLLTYESLMSIINNIYDLNITYGVYDEEGNPGTGTLYTQELILGETHLAKLTPEEIAIATNKGWTVS